VELQISAIVLNSKSINERDRGKAHPVRPIQSRSLLLEFLGAFGRRVGGWFPVATLVNLMTALGLDESNVRTALSRLKQKGWLVAERRKGGTGYSLSALAVASLNAGDQVIWHSRGTAALDDGWVIVSFSIPETNRARRHILRSRLAGLGFGNIGSGLWIAPARMLAEARGVINSLGFADQSDVFTAQYASDQNLRQLVRRAWDFPGLNDGYRTFLRLAEPIAARRLAGGTSNDDSSSFVDYMQTLHAWRTLPFRDPGIPLELLDDDWQGERAARMFESLIAVLDNAAFRVVAQEPALMASADH